MAKSVVFRLEVEGTTLKVGSRITLEDTGDEVWVVEAGGQSVTSTVVLTKDGPEQLETFDGWLFVVRNESNPRQTRHVSHFRIGKVL